MNILEKAKKDSGNKQTKDKLPFAVFICPKSNIDEVDDYKQVFTDIISDKIQEQNFANLLRNNKKYDI